MTATTMRFSTKTAASSQKSPSERDNNHSNFFHQSHYRNFKLHLVINDCGELLNVKVMPGNTNDRKPVVEPLQHLFEKVFADKGYVSQPLARHLQEKHDVTLVAKSRRNMKNYLMTWQDKVLARKRVLVEMMIDQLKNISQIEHSRHLCPVNFCVNLDNI